MTLKNTGEWQLDSGIWLTENIESGFKLVRTAAGHVASPKLKTEDMALFMQTLKSANDTAQFPPEFQYSPANGTPLVAPLAGDVTAPWIPPFGARPIAEALNAEATGLRKSSVTFTLLNKADFNGESEEDAVLPVPPPGEYQFFSGAFGTRANALLAVDTGKGMLFGWLPASENWQALHSASGPLLSESSLPRDSWRGEMATAFYSRLYLPTAAGLACVTPDLPALQYEVSYIGKGAAVGAPVVFNHTVWAPLQLSDGSLQIVGVDADGAACAPLAVSGAPRHLEGVSLPVAYGRMAVWPCQNGQLHLQLQADGSVAAQFLPWPASIVPHFQFGSPYQSSTGALWQLCFDNQEGYYTYLELGKAVPERERADAPRFCSGSVNYRFAAKLKSQPWREPEQGDDVAASEVVIPLLEVGPGAVVGMRLSSRQGLAALLETTDRTRLQLVWDDDNSETVFHTTVVARPWRLRLFTHGGRVWAYHPELQRICGWSLAA
ncbi:hypothetical protein GTP91_21785 [Rugamonas sp. FT82W]|uniref:Uncharacterized protein n=1 Tax=Duganella vulcania TaxID=2692166 RepID=A0A845GAH0_9BURK|nr:hypothetical protein [Duganella vulcania]MYM89799.1 hypothetical protein [Duganella vulcania]